MLMIGALAAAEGLNAWNILSVSNQCSTPQVIYKMCKGENSLLKNERKAGENSFLYIKIVKKYEEKKQKNEVITDRPTDRQTDRPTDRQSEP